MAYTTLARLGMFHLVFITIMGKCGGVLPSYFLALNSGPAERNELIERYFNTGLGYDEISLLLGLLRQLKEDIETSWC